MDNLFTYIASTLHFNSESIYMEETSPHEILPSDQDVIVTNSWKDTQKNNMTIASYNFMLNH